MRRAEGHPETVGGRERPERRESLKRCHRVPRAADANSSMYGAFWVGLISLP
jgi:hypothetical protein